MSAKFWCALFITLSILEMSCAYGEESAPAVQAPAALTAVKAGDKIIMRNRKYQQNGVGGQIALDKTEGARSTATVESDGPDGRTLRFQAGTVQFFGPDLAYVGSISKEGFKTMTNPDTIYHWKPQRDLEAGLEWDLVTDYKTRDTTNQNDCLITRKLHAVSKDTFRDVKIGGQVRRVNAIETDLEGGTYTTGLCVGFGKISMVIVYSRELNLILENDFIGRDGYGNLTSGTRSTVAEVN